MAVSGAHQDFLEARQEMTKIKQETALGSKAIDFLSKTPGLLDLMKSRADRATTAWEEYEEGFIAMGGDVEELTESREERKLLPQLWKTLWPFGDKGFFQMPEDKVTIGGKEYDMEKLRKLGSYYRVREDVKKDDEYIDDIEKYKKIIGL